MQKPDVAVFYQRLKRSLERGEAPVYRHYGEQHTYNELLGLVRRFVHVLQPHRRRRVLVYGGKELASYAAIYGILLSGNVWVPMTPDQATGRNRDILELTEATLLFAGESLPEELAQAAAARGVEVIHFGDLPATAGDFDLPDFQPDDEAYVMFTSGSTGKPKGVPMTHANYINFVLSALDILPFRDNEVFADYHDFAFDISIFYLFCCPLVGGCFVPAIGMGDKILPLRLMQKNLVTVWSSVPSVIARVAQAAPEESVPSAIRIAFLCGEPFSLGVLRYCQSNMAIPDVFNFYGLTETGVENFFHECREDDVQRYDAYGYVPIGLPLPGNDIRVSEDKELLLAGVQVTPGYLGGVGADRFETIDGERWFHTGDILEQHLGVWFCKGRIDSQIKLSGYRIELMDIEVNLKRQPGVAEAVCFVEEAGGRKRLAAVLKLVGAETALDLNLIRREIAKELPGYMIPARMVVVEQLPYNANGKIDRRQVSERHATA